MDYRLFRWTRRKSTKATTPTTTAIDPHHAATHHHQPPPPPPSSHKSEAHLSPEDLALRQIYEFYRKKKGVLDHGPGFWPGGAQQQPEVPGEKVPFVVASHLEMVEAAATRLGYVMNEFMGVHQKDGGGGDIHEIEMMTPFRTRAEMLAFRTEVLELCRVYDDHIMAGNVLDERDTRAVEMLRVFQTWVMPDLVARRLVMGKNGALWERDGKRGGYWVDVTKRVRAVAGYQR